MSDVLWHFTTTTGRWDWSPRSEAPEQVVDDLRGAIGAARTTTAPVPIGDGVAELRIVDEGDGWVAYAILRDDELFASGAVYWTPAGAASAAAFLETAAAAETLPGLLVRPERALQAGPERARWLDRVAPCIAWAFIEEVL